MIQIRPQGGGLPYAPYRDIVNCLPQFVRQAIVDLEPEHRDQWLKDVLESNAITEEQIATGIESIAHYFNNCQSQAFADPQALIESTAFVTLPNILQTLILSKIGQITLASYFAFVRDAFRVDEKPTGLPELLEQINEMSKKLNPGTRPT